MDLLDLLQPATWHSNLRDVLDELRPVFCFWELELPGRSAKSVQPSRPALMHPRCPDATGPRRPALTPIHELTQQGISDLHLGLHCIALRATRGMIVGHTHASLRQGFGRELCGGLELRQLASIGAMVEQC